MFNFNTILESIKKTYSPPKIVDLEEAGLKVELEILTSKEEILVLEACKDIDGSNYVEGVKRHSLACSIKKVTQYDIGTKQITDELDLRKEAVDYIDEKGETKKISKFLYMVDFLAKWPSAIIDLLFDAFTTMQAEVEVKIKSKARFEKFYMSEKPEEEKEDTLRKLKEDETDDEDLTETEKLQKIVEKEAEEENLRIQEAEINSKK